MKKVIFLIIPIAILAILAAFCTPAMAEPCGDVNGDGNAPTYADAVDTLDGVITTSEWAADVDCNGNTPTYADAVSILDGIVDCCTCRVFAEWVNDYEPFLPDLDYCDENAQGFYTELCDDTYWEGHHIYGNDNAKEKHWKDPIYGGSDIADNAEFAFFSGHGEPDSFIFGTEIDDHHLAYYDALWGNDKMNWIAIDACSVLQNTAYWESAFEGLHSICGFGTECRDSASRGQRFARYMDGTWDEKTIADAWCRAVYETEPTYHWGVVLSAHVEGTPHGCRDDHLYAHGPSVEPKADPDGFHYYACQGGQS